jgi:hypothetical protein
MLVYSCQATVDFIIGACGCAFFFLLYHTIIYLATALQQINDRAKLPDLDYKSSLTGHVSIVFQL